MRILKQVLEITDRKTYILPGTKIKPLCVKEQSGNLVMYFETNASADEITDRVQQMPITVCIVGTGHLGNDLVDFDYIGTAMMPLRKLIDKFKSWLIGKLGGFTFATQTQEIKVYRPVPIKLCATLKTSGWDYYKNPQEDIGEDEIKGLVGLVVHEIIEKNLYVLDKYRDIETNGMTYRIQVNVVEPLR